MKASFLLIQLMPKPDVSAMARTLIAMASSPLWPPVGRLLHICTVSRDDCVSINSVKHNLHSKGELLKSPPNTTAGSTALLLVVRRLQKVKHIRFLRPILSSRFLRTDCGCGRCVEVHHMELFGTGSTEPSFQLAPQSRSLPPRSRNTANHLCSK